MTASFDDIRSACAVGDLDKVASLVEQHRDLPPSADYSSDWSKQLRFGLTEAVSNGHRQIVAYLLSNGLKISKPALVACIVRGDTQIFQEFLQHDFDINSTDFKGPPLRLAVGRLEMMEWLLDNGADPNVTSAGNFETRLSPLAAAVGLPSTTSAALLLDRGAHMEPDTLHDAIFRTNDSVNMVKFLIKRGADVNFQSNEWGKWGTPLHCAVREGDKETTRALLDAGADPSIVSERGGTPADIARSNGRTEILGLLEDAMRSRSGRDGETQESRD